MIKTDMGRRGPSIGQQLSSPRAYKRSPALTNSTWYKGMLHSQMAGTADNNGAFDFVISKIRRGTEATRNATSARRRGLRGCLKSLTFPAEA
jgi:hypothetical protein